MYKQEIHVLNQMIDVQNTKREIHVFITKNESMTFVLAFRAAVMHMSGSCHTYEWVQSNTRMRRHQAMRRHQGIIPFHDSRNVAHAI